MKPFWEKAEKRIAKKTGTSLVPRSGAGIIRKGDCGDADRMIEVKSSTMYDNEPYIIIHAEWFRKIKRQAHAVMKDPYVALVLSTDEFLFRYAPFDAIPSGAQAINATAKVTKTALIYGWPGILIDGELWIRESLHP